MGMREREVEVSGRPEEHNTNKATLEESGLEAQKRKTRLS